MYNKFFTVEVKPFIKASHQAAGSAAFANDDVLFDWHAFQIPRGAARLLSVNVVFRGTDGASQTVRDLDLFWAKSIDGTAPATIGDANATMSAAPVVSNHIIGMSHIETTEYGNDSIDYFNVAQTGSGAGASIIPNLVLEGEPHTGDNVGYDTLYVAGACGGAMSFGTTVLTRGAVEATATTVPTDKGSDDDPDADLIFAVGDIIHSATDDVLGELTSIGAFSTNNQPLGFSGGSAAVSDNEELFNVYPIKLVLSFER